MKRKRHTEEACQERKRRRLLPVFLMGILVLIVGAALGVTYGRVAAGDRQDFTGLPRLEISLNGVDLEEIMAGTKDIKYGGNALKLVNGGGTTEFTEVEVKGRGNATWIFAKRPYQIKFSEKVDLFNLGKARKWVLLANYLDHANLRTDMAFYVKRMMGETEIVRGEFVELVVDGEYQGLYYLTPKVEISKTRVDLREPDGVLVELDNIYGLQEEKYAVTAAGMVLVEKDVVAEDLADAVLMEFAAEFEALETAVEQGDWEGVTAVADAESLVRYFLLSEFVGNQDAYVTSWYFYKDGFDDLIHAGPGWDFDGAFGNVNWGDYEKYARFYEPGQWLERRVLAFGGDYYNPTSGTTTSMERNAAVAQLMYRLTEMPEFQELTGQLWQKYFAGRRGEILAYFDTRAELIRSAAELNAVRWEFDDFDDDTAYLRKWIEARYDVMDRLYGWRLPTFVTEI